MRKTSLVLNFLVVLFFSAFLAWTFSGRAHLESLARRFVTEKTVEHSAPIVNMVEHALQAPVVQKVLSDEQRAAIEHEVAEYRRDASAYVADLSRQAPAALRAIKPNPMLARVTTMKEQMRRFYDRTLAALIADLRIFAGTNLLAGLAGLMLAYRSPPAGRAPVVASSLLLVAAVLYCSTLYIDDLTFFRILFRTHPGWWYPVMVAAVVVMLWVELSRAQAKTNEQDFTELRSAAGTQQSPMHVDSKRESTSLQRE